MKYILVILLTSFAYIPSFAQQKLSHVDSLILSRIDTVGPWKGIIYYTKNGKLIIDENAPNWPTEALLDSFFEKSADVTDVFAFIKANTRLLYQNFGNQDFYFLAITNKEVIKIKVSKGKPQISQRERRENSNHQYWSPDAKFIKRISYFPLPPCISTALT